ncbi:two-pore potassium channel 1-like protein [Tanacetum coccineum]
MAEDGLKEKLLIRRKHQPSNETSSNSSDHHKPSISRVQLSLKQVAILLAAYLALGTICFYIIRDQISGTKTNGIIDSMYFCVVTMTTLGYGDLVPHSNLSKVMACVFVFMGMGLGGFALSKAADYIVEKEEILFVKAIHIRDQTVCDPHEILNEAERYKVKYKLYAILTLIVLLVIVGTTFLTVVEKLSLFDAFYCVCSTITTLGYGDKSFSSGGGRLFAVFWIITSTISLAQLFAYLVELWTETRQRKLMDWVLHRKLTIQDIEKADLDNDNSVSPAEYIVYKLKEMGLVSEQLIMNVLEGFKDQDVDHSGTLTANDISDSQWKRATRVCGNSKALFHKSKDSRSIHTCMAEDGVKDAVVTRRKHQLKGVIPFKGTNYHKPKHENDHQPPPSISQIDVRLNQVAILLGVYLAVGTICFFLVRDQINGKKTNGVLDAMYFSVVTMTTVGYGDLVPDTNFAKLLACIYVFMGMALGGFALSKAADYIVEKEVMMFVKAINVRETYGPNQILNNDEGEETNKVKYRFFIGLALIVFLVNLGIVFLILAEDMSIVDAFYCVCSTITTLGYGDKSFLSKRGRVFAVFWILTSTILLARLFVYLVELWTENRQKQLVDWVLHRKLTIQDIENADLDNDKSVSPAEYVVYKLKEMGLVSDQLIMSVMEGFKNLDLDNSGTLTANDLSTGSISRSRSMVAGVRAFHSHSDMDLHLVLRSTLGNKWKRVDRTAGVGGIHPLASALAWALVGVVVVVLVVVVVVVVELV